MPDYRRACAGNTWFFTLVTGQRRAILCDDRLHPLLRQTLKTAKERWPFRIDAWVLLPDHLHCIWTLPERRYGFLQAAGKEFGKQARSVVGTAHPVGSNIDGLEAGDWSLPRDSSFPCRCVLSAWGSEFGIIAANREQGAGSIDLGSIPPPRLHQLRLGRRPVLRHARWSRPARR